jgi:hydroxylamine reductase (hybrid-cluster protein)
MQSYRFEADDDNNTKTIRKMNHVVELERRKHLLLTALKGISVYAHKARQFTLTDREIDRFTVETLDKAVSENPMGLEHIKQLLDTADTMRNRAKKLYHWACELFAKEPKSLTTTTVRRTSIDPRHVLFDVDSNEKMDSEATVFNRERLYWEGVCAQKLNTVANLAIFQLESGTLSHDICGAVHEMLDLLSRDLTIFELIDLSVYLEADPIALLNERATERASMLKA